MPRCPTPPARAGSARASLAVVLAFATALASFAQDAWTSVPAPTSQNLWGVAHRSIRSAPSFFVAVGDAGTVLTSGNGLTWTPRPSGTTRWLTVVTFANDQFVAVGDTGSELKKECNLRRSGGFSQDKR